MIECFKAYPKSIAAISCSVGCIILLILTCIFNQKIKYLVVRTKHVIQSKNKQSSCEESHSSIDLQPSGETSCLVHRTKFRVRPTRLSRQPTTLFLQPAILSLHLPSCLQYPASIFCLQVNRLFQMKLLHGPLSHFTSQVTSPCQYLYSHFTQSSVAIWHQRHLLTTCTTVEILSV